MNFRAGKPVFWTLITAAGLSAATVSPDSKEQAPDIAAQIAKLSDDSYPVRESATRELWKLGEAVLPELQQAARGRDPEAAIRARDLVRKIELGILPDSSSKIVELVMRYDQGSKDLRQRVIRELRNERAYRQILKLYALEKDRETLAMLDLEVQGVALDAARECLSSDPPDIRSAFDYLMMAHPRAGEYMAMAGIHRSAGTLDKAIRESGEAAEPDHLQRFCLLASAGRLSEAADEAERAGLEVISARLKMLAGDPLPWLAVAPSSPQAPSPPGLATYREVAAAIWRGEKPEANDLRELRRLALGGDEDDQVKTLMLLFLIGDHAEAEGLLTKLSPTAAFTHFDATERVDDALKSIGIDPEKPDYTAWAAKRFHVFLEAPETERNELAELETLGSFLERRGLYRELEEAFVPSLVELSEANQDDFLMLITRLFPQGADDHSPPVIRPVLKAAAAYAGDDEMRWVQVVEHLFDSYGSPAQVWSWLAQMEPEMERGERLELLAGIHLLLPDAANRRASFHKKAWALVEKAEKVERKRLVEVLVGTLSSSKDPELLLRCIGELEDAEGSRFGWDRYKGMAFMALGRWDEAANLWLENAKQEPGEPFYRVYAAACLRRAGKESAAAEQEAKADLLCLGETRALFQGGKAFAEAGDFARARVWWQRAANECSGDYVNFSDALDQLTDAACWESDWKTAATLREAGLLDLAIAPEKSAFSSSVCQKARVESDFMRGFALLPEDRSRALETIRPALEQPFADTALADYFFAQLRAAGLVKLHDEAFEKHWNHIQSVISRFPTGENARNSAAWLASRATRHLDEAEKLLTGVLKTSPHQGAYLDTMAEIHFARGDRAKAVEYSDKALEEEPANLQLRRQHQRFTSAPLPE
jgi:tetratricopeptide (TPR) repeat protein